LRDAPASQCEKMRERCAIIRALTLRGLTGY
jgi:hypothetical protein